MLRFALHGVSSFPIVPLRIGILFGFIASFISLASVLYAIMGKIIEGHSIPSWASSLAIFFVRYTLPVSGHPWRICWKNPS